METPVFRLGLVGFDTHEEETLRQGVAQYRNVHWHCGRVDGSDAWLINGARVGRVRDSSVRVIAPNELPAGTALMLDVQSRPTAIAGPAPKMLAQMTNLWFELRQADTLTKCLSDLDRSLASLRRQYWIAGLLIERNASVGKAVYELRSDSQLLAVSKKNCLFASPNASEEQFRQATWRHCARDTVEVPADFIQHPLSELLWAYTTRTRRNLLPGRYMDSPIYLRRPPRLRPELLEDIHLLIMRELTSRPANFIELQSALNEDETTLSRALADLYYVGSVTSSPDRAGAASQHGDLWFTRAGPLDEREVSPRPMQEQPPSTVPLE